MISLVVIVIFYTVVEELPSVDFIVSIGVHLSEEAVKIGEDFFLSKWVGSGLLVHPLFEFSSLQDVAVVSVVLCEDVLDVPSAVFLGHFENSMNLIIDSTFRCLIYTMNTEIQRKGLN